TILRTREKNVFDVANLLYLSNDNNSISNKQYLVLLGKIEIKETQVVFNPSEIKVADYILLDPSNPEGLDSILLGKLLTKQIEKSNSFLPQGFNTLSNY